MTNRKNKKEAKKNKIMAVIIILLIVVFAGVFIVGSQLEKQRSEELQNQETPVATDEPIYGDEMLGIDPAADENLQGYHNILFLGTDAPDEDTGETRSDGIVIISINKETKDVKIFSVARDTYMEVEQGSDEKITHAYMHAGLDQTLWALNHTLDLNIRDAIVFDWEAVANVVDRVGGVQVELTEHELSYLNDMVPADNQVPGTGTQIINGEQAVMYSRMRKDVETLSDFRRNERLKIVLTDALKKAQSLPDEQLVVFAEETLDDVITNMRSETIVEMAQAAKEYTIVKSDETFPFVFKGMVTEHTGRVFVPISLESNIAKLYSEYFGITEYKMSETSDSRE